MKINLKLITVCQWWLCYFINVRFVYVSRTDQQWNLDGNQNCIFCGFYLPYYFHTQVSFVYPWKDFVGVFIDSLCVCVIVCVREQQPCESHPRQQSRLSRKQGELNRQASLTIR